MPLVTEPARQLEVIAEVDVCVIGGGPGGLPAAVAAARAGARTMLVERYGFLGGMATAGLIGPILSHRAHESTQPILGGIPQEICRRLHECGGAPPWEEALQQWGVPFDPEVLKLVADEIVCEAGPDLLLHTWFAGTLVEDGRIAAAVVESKSGRQAIRAKMFVDATGDADVAFRAGAPTRQGRDADGAVESMGSMFRVGGIRTPNAEEAQAAAAALQAAIESGELCMYNPGIGGRSSTLRLSEVTPNVTRFAGDPTSARDLTTGELRLRRDTRRIVDFYRKHVPGYEECFLSVTPAQIGIRESRQIVGSYALTAADILTGRIHEDAIALGSWWIDIHCPLGRVQHHTHVCRADCPSPDPCPMLEQHRDRLLANLYPPAGGAYGIPYRSLVAQRVSNLLVSGRCISATHEGMGGARVMGTCMAIGQAAGTAAAIAAEKGLPAAEVNVATLQAALRADGAVLSL